MKPPPFCPAVEARVLAALIGENGALDFAGKLELEDFADYRHRAILTAIRELQVTGDKVDILTVADAIALRDMQRDTHVADHASLVWITCMVIDAPPYHLHLGRIGWSFLFGDMVFLRKLAKQRAEIAARSAVAA